MSLIRGFYFLLAFAIVWGLLAGLAAVILAIMFQLEIGVFLVAISMGVALPFVVGRLAYLDWKEERDRIKVNKVESELLRQFKKSEEGYYESFISG